MWTFLIFYSIENKGLGAHFLVKKSFFNFNFSTQKSCAITKLQSYKSIRGHLQSGRMVINFVTKGMGRRRCRSWPSWLVKWRHACLTVVLIVTKGHVFVSRRLIGVMVHSSDKTKGRYGRHWFHFTILVELSIEIDGWCGPIGRIS